MNEYDSEIRRRCRVKQNQQQQPLMETEVWVCGTPPCKCWMRVDLAFEQSPTCPICGSHMERDVRMLPKIEKPKG